MTKKSKNPETVQTVLQVESVGDIFDRIVENAKVAGPDQGARIDNHSMLLGFIVSSLATLNNEQLVKIMKFMCEQDMDNLDGVNHTFVVP